MTFSDNLNTDQDVDFEEEESSYPVAFGITFTPPVSGIALGLLGLVVAVYILLTFFMPAFEEYNTLREDETDKESRINQEKSGQIDQKMVQAEINLQESQALRNQVLSLFSSEKSLKTLLLDINRFVEARQVTLKSFEPTGNVAIVTDNSLGKDVRNKLKRQSFEIEIEGSFEKTHELLQDLERLQPLLIVNKLDSQRVAEAFEVKLIKSQDNNGEVAVQGQAIPVGLDLIKTTFTLDAILPLTPEEMAKLAASAKEKEEEKEK